MGAGFQRRSVAACRLEIAVILFLPLAYAVELCSDAVFCSNAVCVCPFICLSICPFISSLPSANAIHSKGLDAASCALPNCGNRQMATKTRLMIRNLIYSLFSFIVFYTFTDERHDIEAAPDAYQIQSGGVPVH